MSEDRLDIKLLTGQTDKRNSDTNIHIDRYNEYKLSLEYALNKYTRYLSYFIYYMNDRAFVNKQAQRMAVVESALSLIHRDGYGSQAKIISILVNCETFIPLGLSRKAKYLYDYLKRASKARHEGTLVDFIVHNLKGEKSNNTKINDKVEKVIIYLARNGNKLVDKIIQHQTNVILTVYPELNKSKLLGRKAINDFLNRPHVRNLVQYGSDPDSLSTLLPEVYCTKSEYPLKRAYIDGTQLQFVNVIGDVIQEVVIIIILDCFSSKVIGYSLSDTEDSDAIMDALDLMLDWTRGRIPEEIVTDRHSALTGKRFSRFIDVCNKLGSNFSEKDFSKIELIQSSNPQSKASVERFFRSFQDAYLSPYFGYVGEGIKSNNPKAFPNRILKIFMQRKEYLKDRQKLDDFLLHQLISYNRHGFFYKADGPSDSYDNHRSANGGIEVPLDLIPCLLFEKKTMKIKNCAIKTQIDNQEYIFQQRSIDTLLDLNGEAVDVYFDKKRLDRLYIYKKDSFNKICEFDRISRIPPSKRSRNKEQTTLYETIMKDKRNLKGHLDELLITNNKEVEEMLGPIVPEKLMNHSVNSKEELFDSEYKGAFSEVNDEKHTSTDLLYRAHIIQTKKRKKQKKKVLPFPEL